ncbi:MAG: protein translocase subunit SecF [Eubacteriales bacterium]|nr:protein translocase subunit SecF [Eubacteriales bacterium]
MKKYSKFCLLISASIILVALVLSAMGYGINFGIDFDGGLNIKYQMNQAFEQADVEEALRAQGISEFKISKAGSEGTELQIRIREIQDEGVQALRTSLEQELVAKYPSMNTEDVAVGYVGPVAGATLLKNAFLSVLLAAGLMLLYIAFRFDLNSGVAAVIGLLHDVLIMVSFMVLFRSIIQMNSTFIAAALTIVGYSINNTIIIFDRIRENNKKYSATTEDKSEIVDRSVKESLGRTINTTLTTLITIVSLYVFGVDSIKEFALPIIVGVIAGVYSANMINGYVWAYLAETKLLQRSKKKIKRA